MSSNLLKQLII